MTNQHARMTSPLPGIYLKCTSMIMDTANFTINYTAPATPHLLRSSLSPKTTQSSPRVSSSSQSALGNPACQVSWSSCKPATSPTHCNDPNVRMTLQYVGTKISVTGEIINPKDQLSVFQQVCGGENLCLFRGYLSPGEMFQIVSRHHEGFPFSASFYVNGLIVARLRVCCEYRYRAGLQLEKRGCFHITHLSGGKPCHRCAGRCDWKKAGRDHSTSSACEEPVTSKDKGTTGNTQRPCPDHGTQLQALPPARQKRRRKRKKHPPPQNQSDSEQENKLYGMGLSHRRLQQRDSKRSLQSASRTPGTTIAGKDSGMDREHHSALTVRDGRRVSSADKVKNSNKTLHSPWPSKETLPPYKHGGLPPDTEQQGESAQSIHGRLARALSKGTNYSEVELSDSSDSSNESHSASASQVLHMASSIQRIQQPAAKIDEEEGPGPVISSGEKALVTAHKKVAQIKEVEEGAEHTSAEGKPIQQRTAESIESSWGPSLTAGMGWNEERIQPEHLRAAEGNEEGQGTHFALRVACNKGIPPKPDQKGEAEESITKDSTIPEPEQQLTERKETNQMKRPSLVMSYNKGAVQTGPDHREAEERKEEVGNGGCLAPAMSSNKEEAPSGPVQQALEKIQDEALGEAPLLLEVEKMEDEDAPQRKHQADAGLLSQVADLIAILQQSDEVDELVLRNTGMTNALLDLLAPAIVESSSEVKSINLNLNEISPEGVDTLLRLLRRKRSIQSLLLYGNRLGDDGVKTLMLGLSELTFTQRGEETILSPEPLILSELDLGGNNLGHEALSRIAAYLSQNPPLTHLGLANLTAPVTAWRALCHALKINTNLTHLLLKGNSLGDAGAKQIAEVLQENQFLVTIDLDSNEIGEEGGRAIAKSLVAVTGAVLTTISLEDNHISEETLASIQRSLTQNQGLWSSDR